MEFSTLEYINTIAETVRVQTARTGSFVTQISGGYLLAVALGLAMFSLIARSALVSVVCLIFLGSALGILLDPASAAPIIALAFATLSGFVALGSALSKTRTRQVQGQIDALRQQVTALETSETRRFMKDLKTSPPEIEKKS